ncbi:MAG: hypothetical protein JW862_01110 [Anaerolineales bacterium]|nr:hypothetical protein [Anaerolineales bacterium]
MVTRRQVCYPKVIGSPAKGPLSLASERKKGARSNVRELDPRLRTIHSPAQISHRHAAWRPGWSTKYISAVKAEKKSKITEEKGIKKVSEMDFHLEFNIEVPNIKEEFLAKIGEELSALSDEHNDLIGAAIAVEQIAGVEESYLYQARIVAYIRPENIAAVAKAASPEIALKDALSQIQEQINEDRGKRRQIWQRPDLRSNVSLYDLTAREIYDTFVGDMVMPDLLPEGRDKIAATLMRSGKLDQESAYYAADQILTHWPHAGEKERGP